MTMTTAIARRSRRFRALYTSILTLIVSSLLLVIDFESDSLHKLENSDHRMLRRIHGIFTDEQATLNANIVKQWRQEYENKCQDETTTSDELLTELKFFTKPSMISFGTHEDSLPIQPCRQVLVDFGANVGDSLLKSISAGIPKCFSKLPNFHPSFNATIGGVTQSFRGGNQLVSWSWNRFKDYSSLQLMAEDYCYFGIEGNPAFTARLKNLERQIMRSIPRPVRRVHFFTETVGAGEDGPTKLYLDTINQEKNAWGSSLLSTHKDVQASAATNNGERVEASVQGITLATLLKQIVVAERGAHVIAKVDIEGGEFALLEQAAWDGSVCDLLKQGIRIDMILEGHNEDVTGRRTPEQQEKFQKARDKLVKCGMNLWFVKDAG